MTNGQPFNIELEAVEIVVDGVSMITDVDLDEYFDVPEGTELTDGQHAAAVLADRIAAAIRANPATVLALVDR